MTNLHSLDGINLSQDILDCLLDEFDGIINSKRLRSRISTISELIDVLWKRNIFYSNQSVWDEIFKYLPTVEQRDQIRNYVFNLKHNNYFDILDNAYAKARQESSTNVAQVNILSSIQPSQSNQMTQNPTIPKRPIPNEQDSKKRHTIFTFLCESIDNWRDLGRCFDMKDSELNQIGNHPDLRSDIKLITNSILQRMEEKYGDQFEEQLCAVLNIAGRKDIIRDLKKLKLI